MKCTKCKIDYPPGCVSDACIDGDYMTLCAQCALEETNQFHGLTRERFDGLVAEEMRQRVLAHRRKMERTESF